MRNLIRNAKRKYEKNWYQAMEETSGLFFANTKQRTQSRPSLGPLTDSDGKAVTGNEEMADLLNQSFKTCFTREDTRNGQVGGLLRESCEEKIKDLRPESAAGDQTVLT